MLKPYVEFYGLPKKQQQRSEERLKVVLPIYRLIWIKVYVPEDLDG